MPGSCLRTPRSLSSTFVPCVCAWTGVMPCQGPVSVRCAGRCLCSVRLCSLGQSERLSLNSTLLLLKFRITICAGAASAPCASRGQSMRIFRGVDVRCPEARRPVRHAAALVVHRQ